MEDALEAGLEVVPHRSQAREQFKAIATLRNRSDQWISLNLEPLRSASLALEIVGADGRPVLLPPPPIPRGPAERKLLEPGGSYEREFCNFVPQWTPPGHYRVRLVYKHHANGGQDWDGKATSEWVEFEIAE